MIHDIAARGFGATVDAYRRSRPSYPAAAIDWLIERLAIGSGSKVVDLGAGTGMLTAQLLPTGAQIVAVEPLESMRAALAEELPKVRVIDGSAESMPLANASADSIVVGQAFHWFDLPRALPEFHRVLRSGGRLGVIWNDLDTTVDWVADLNAIVAVARTGTPHPSLSGRAKLGASFGPRRASRFAHAHFHDRASLLDRVASMSFVAVQPDAARARILAEVDALVAGHPQLTGRDTFRLPYVTHAWWAERIDRGPASA